MKVCVRYYKKHLSILLSVALIIGIITLAPFTTAKADATPIDISSCWGTATHTYTISSSGTIDLKTLTGTDAGGLTLTVSGNYSVDFVGDSTKTFTNLSIVIASGAEVMLNNVNIDNTTFSASPVVAGDGDTGNTLYFEGSNTLRAKARFAAVYVPLNSSIILSGTNGGTLNANGSDEGAGIGGDSLTFGITSGGSVTITKGTVNAAGGNTGAGIGGGSGGSGCTITILGGTVNATSTWGAGIGGGYGGSGGTVTINGGTVTSTSITCSGIGCGNSGSGGTVTITGGSVKASIQGTPTNGSSNGNNPVCLTTVILKTSSGAAIGATKISLLTTDVGYTYGTTDMCTDSSGKLYLYLPTGTLTTYAQTTDGAATPTLSDYYGSITTASNGSASGTLTAPVIHVTKVDLSSTSASITGKGSLSLTATVTPSNATDKSVTWSSSNTSVATVSSTGVVTGVSGGIADITAKTTDGGFTKTCRVYVDAEFPTISSNPTDKTVKWGEDTTLTCTASVSSGVLSYPWYSNTIRDIAGGKKINSATGSSFSPPTNTVGTTYYYCLVTDTFGGASAEVASSVVGVTVNKLTLKSITAPTAITGLANGTAKIASALGLPSTVTLKTDGVDVSANVIWDVDHCSYDASSTSAQIFTVNGSVTLPSYVLNTDSVPLTTSISVSVNKASSGGGSSSSSGGGTAAPYYTVSADKSTNGTITLSTTSVAGGGSITATITPDKGYQIADVLINGVSVGAVSSYAINDISKNTTVQVVFKKIEEAWRNPYSDVQESAWYYDAVGYVSQKGLMTGTNANSFDPNGDMTRAMVVTVLLRLNKDSGSFEHTFSDVASGAWYEKAAAWAAKNGIASGLGNNSFAPDNKLSREQLAVMLYNYAKYKGLNVAVTNSSVLKGYADLGNVSTWASDAMKWAVSVGIISGDGKNLNPQDNATRAQIAAILQRFIEKVIS